MRNRPYRRASIAELAFTVFADRARPVSSAQQYNNFPAKSGETFRSETFLVVE